MNILYDFLKKFTKEEEEVPRCVRAYICDSSDKECMENYKLLTKHYEYQLKNKRMTINCYREVYNPHYTIGNKLYNNEIEIYSKEYNNDKERRINNFLLYGKFEIE